MIAWSAVLGAYVAGVVGGMHCIAMCGGFAAAVAPLPASAPLQPARKLAAGALASNIGRVATYTLVGALVGGIGNGLFIAADWLPVQRALYVIANLMLIAVAVTLVAQREPLRWLQGWMGPAFVAIAPVFARVARRDAIGARLALGMLWGLVPCAMIYSVLPLALFAGDAAQGALVMLAFGLGTLPNLLAAGWLVARVRTCLDAIHARAIAAVVLASFAIVGIARALGDSSSLASNPFCLLH